MKIKVLTLKGFSLIEMAIVLLVMGLVVIGALLTLSKVDESVKVKETDKRLQQAKEAVLNFVLINGRLPCPANANSNGLSSPNISGSCTVNIPQGNNGQSGYLPAVNLGLSSLDGNSKLFNGGWDDSANVGGQYPRAIRYAVTNTNTSALTTSGVITNTTQVQLVANNLPNASNGNGFKICSDIACVTPLAYNAAIVIWSTGKNGNAMANYSLEENQNWNQATPRLFISHPPTNNGAANGIFDDQVIWISYQEVVAKLIQGGHVN